MLRVQVLAGDRGDALENAQRAPVGVGFHLLEPDLSEQGFFITDLDAQLADVLHAAVGGLVDALQFLFVDAPDVAQEMHAQAGERVVPLQARLEFHAAEIGAVHGQPRRFFLGEVGAQQDIFEARPLAQLLAEVLQVGLVQADHLLQFLQQRIHVIHLFRDDFQRVHRVVLRQHHAVAVEHQSARRLDRDRLDAVGLRQRFEVAMRENLQINQTQEQRQDQRQDDDADHRQARVEQPAFPELILDRDIQHEALELSEMQMNHEPQMNAGHQDKADLSFNPAFICVLAVQSQVI